jgi:hypothetical protein
MTVTVRSFPRCYYVNRGKVWRYNIFFFFVLHNFFYFLQNRITYIYNTEMHSTILHSRQYHCIAISYLFVVLCGYFRLAATSSRSSWSDVLLIMKCNKAYLSLLAIGQANDTMNEGLSIAVSEWYSMLPRTTSNTSTKFRWC